MSVFDAFQTGAAVGKRKAPFSGVMENFKTRAENQAKLQSEIGVDYAKKKNELAMEEESAKRVMGGGDSSGYTPSEFKIGSVTYKNPQYQEDVKKLQTEAMMEREMNKKQALGAGAESGKLTLANESIRNIRDMRKILFPDGTPDSFKRQSAFAMRPFPFNKPIPNSYEGQTLYRKGGAAIAGRQLIQTGVAAREEEHQQLIDQFITNAFSNPQSAFDSLSELEKFYTDYGQMADPQGYFMQRADTAQDASRSGGIDIGQEKMKVSKLLASHPERKSLIVARFKERTGQNYE